MNFSSALLLFWCAMPLFLLAAACTNTEKPGLKTGLWRAVIETRGKEIPFHLEVVKSESGSLAIFLINGSERQHIPAVRQQADSVYIEMPVVDAEIKAKISGNTLTGLYYKNHPTNSYTLPFTATYGIKDRFLGEPKTPATNITGKWAVTFIKDAGKTTDAIGIFEQKNSAVTGTFLTATGDYRFLEGRLWGNKLQLSTFDGGFLYLFEADLQNDGTLKGEFWSGKTGYQAWKAQKDAGASLKDAGKLTTLQPGTETISFAFPDLEGQPVSLTDDRFKNKVVIVQILGSWCPNCLDETAFLAPWYADNKDKGVEIIGLAYEYSPEFTKAAARVKRLKERFDVQYPLVIAGTPGADAAKTLPMLSGINAYPTTILIDKNGKVRKIHTGFSGPGTGEYYEKFVEEFEGDVAELLSE